MTPALAAQLRIIRAAADLLEQAGIEDLAIGPSREEIVIQVPSHAGSPAERAAAVAALAALAGCEPAPDCRPGPTKGWLFARGLFARLPVCIYTPVTPEASS
jgi:hypothetical protein